MPDPTGPTDMADDRQAVISYMGCLFRPWVPTRLTFVTGTHPTRLTASVSLLRRPASALLTT